MEDLKWITEYNNTHNNEYAGYFKRGKYLAIWNPNHHLSSEEGYVYIHRLQAEKKLGRDLKRSECVHHIDLNKYNNDVNNLMIFKTISDHTAYHMGSKIYLDGDVYVAESNKNLICPICGNTKDNKAKLCLKCSFINKRKIKRPNKEELIYLIKNNSFTNIGNMFNVSDNAIRKWCKAYGLPYKTSVINSMSEEEWKIMYEDF